MARILLIIGVALVAMLAIGCASPASEVNKPQTPQVPPSVPTPSAPPAEMPPTELKLTITEPADNSIVPNSMVSVKGKTSPGAVVSLNGEMTSADSVGNFSMTVILEEGPNLIEVIASDSYGNEAATTLTVVLNKGG